jgi:potassium/hydrogen antiporter
VTHLHTVEIYLAAGSALLVLSVLSSKAIGRLGVPSLLVFLLIGMLAGSEGLGGIEFENAFQAQSLGIIALIYILFAGGLDTDFKIIRPVLFKGALLASLGVLLTCALTGWFATTVLGFTWLEGLLLGAIVSSTDAAAVFTVLRGKNVNFTSGIKPLLELESGANDPMAVMLTVTFLQIMTSQELTPSRLIVSFLQQLILGGVFGFVAGKGMGALLNRLKLEFEGLYPVMTIASIVFVYGATQLVGGNGFLAVYLCGLVLGSSNFIHKKSLILFHDGIAWLMQITMFLVLGLLAFPSRLAPVAGAGLLASTFLILVARPIAVFVSLSRTSMSVREKALISWIGLRGSVPIILAIYPLLAGIAKAEVIFYLVFFIVLTSVLVQGTSIPLVARLLGVNSPEKPKFRFPIEYVPSENLRSELVEVDVPARSTAIGRTLVELALPKGALIVLIQRKGQVFVPRGGTHLEANDTLLVLAEKSAQAEIKALTSQTQPKRSSS